MSARRVEDRIFGSVTTRLVHDSIANRTAEVVGNVVAMAVTDGARSVALPLFGAGVGGLSVEASLTAILEALEAAAPSVPGPLFVEIAVRDGDEFEQAEAVFAGFEALEARQAEANRLAEEAVRELLGDDPT